ncbi:hypothetical protein DAT39_018986, partial [Clarias magur]
LHHSGFMVFVSVWLFEVLILLSLLVGALYIFPRLHRKRRISETQVSSVKVSYSCSSPGVMKVFCSADGDNLHFNWTPDLNTLSHLENRTSTLILDKDHHGKVTCSVENHVSRDHITTEVQPCPAQVSAVKVSYSCLSPGVMKVSCSADGDNLRFNWTPDLNTLSHQENRTSTLILDKDHHGKVTCSVENHVSHDHITTEPCPGPTTVQSTLVQYTVVQNALDHSGFMVFVSVWLFEIIILLSLLVGAPYIYTRHYRKWRLTE